MTKGRTTRLPRKGAAWRARTVRWINGLRWQALLATGLAIPASAILVAPGGGSQAVAAAAAIADPLAALDGRSPGSRNGAALTQTKHRLLPPPVSVPVERLLSQERTRPQAPAGYLPGETPPGAIDNLLPVGPVGYAGSPVAGGPGYIGSPGGYSSPPVSGIGPGGGTGGGGGGGGGGETPVSPPIGAVPEPSTWATTILGFLAIAAVVRRRRASVAGRRPQQA